MISRISGLLLCALIAACTSAPPPTQTSTPGATPSAPPTIPSASATPAGSPATPPGSASPSPTGSAAASPTASATPIPSGLEGQLVVPGTLTACISVVGLPASGLTEDGQLDGYNVAFATEIAARMELELDIQQPLFEDLIEELTAHRCDVAISSLNITADRATEVSFVPYTRSIQPVVVTSGNPQTIDSLDALCGLAVSAAAGTTHVDLVEGLGDYAGQGLNASCVAAGGEPIDLHTFDTELEAVTALLEGEVVAYLGNPNFVFDFPDQLEYSQANLPPARQGMAVALDRPAVSQAIQATLQSMIDDGSYRGILVQYLPNEDSVNAVSIEEL